MLKVKGGKILLIALAVVVAIASTLAVAHHIFNPAQAEQEEVIETVDKEPITGTPLIEQVSEKVEDIKLSERLVEPEPIEQEPLPQYCFTCENDLQYPEYPTGCEAVATAVMMRMNGIDVDNVGVVDAIPRSNGEDFVHAYWGDPATYAGFAVMSPGIEETLNRILPIEKTALRLDGTRLNQLPTPTVIWVTMYFDTPIPTEYEQEGYRLFLNTHCVVLLSCSDATAKVWDPLQGEIELSYTTLDSIYRELGCQAVYIAPRGYTLEGSSPMDENEVFEEQERLEEYEALMQQVEDGLYDGDGPKNVAEPEEPEGDA